MVVIGMLIGPSLTPLNPSRTLRAVRRREAVRRSYDNSRRKAQNVRWLLRQMDTGLPSIEFRGLVKEANRITPRTDSVTRYVGIATRRLAGPASTCEPRLRQPVSFSHAETSSSLYTSPSPNPIRNVSAIRAA